ncbi:MAG TPA: DUF2059 domain-containing protein [Candidatus Angelobacter sp.]|nr:DUF2059 domain-containing protein [Candidatus Angelobacter sp.]
MRSCAAFVLFVFAGLSFAVPRPPLAVSPQQASAPKAGAVDPAKAADIRRLLEVSGAKKIMEDTMAAMSDTIRPMLVGSLPPGEYREKLVDLFFAKFKSKANLNEMLDMAVPVYDKYFSQEEIRGLVRFYETPLGQKAISTMPQLMNDLRSMGQKWGEQLGRQSMQEVLKENPDLQQALEAAARAQQK